MPSVASSAFMCHIIAPMQIHMHYPGDAIIVPTMMLWTWWGPARCFDDGYHCSSVSIRHIVVIIFKKTCVQFYEGFIDILMDILVILHFGADHHGLDSVYIKLNSTYMQVGGQFNLPNLLSVLDGMTT